MDLVGYDFPSVPISLEDFAPAGSVLDLGGGGEGVIGQAVGGSVIAIDRWMDELREAPDGFRKVMMDARHLGFPDQRFPTLTAFFSFMYIPKVEDQIAVFTEAGRVLQPGGIFHLWDVRLPETPPEGTDYFVVDLLYRIRGKDTGTGYGMRWPGGRRDAAHYIALAEQAGLACIHSEAMEHCFYLQFQK